jgi:hypothetical protein
VLSEVPRFTNPEVGRVNDGWQYKSRPLKLQRDSLKFAATWDRRDAALAYSARRTPALFAQRSVGALYDLIY